MPYLCGWESCCISLGERVCGQGWGNPALGISISCEYREYGKIVEEITRNLIHPLDNFVLLAEMSVFIAVAKEALGKKLCLTLQSSLGLQLVMFLMYRAPDLLTLYMINFQREQKHILTFYVIPPHLYDTGSGNLSSSKTRTYLSYIVNIMGADVLAMQGARASATMILTMLNKINSVIAR